MLLPGQVDADEADALLSHAAECDWCGAVLREAAQDLAGPPTREEEELAAKARFADPVRRRELAESITRRVSSRENKWLPVWHWWPAVAAMATLLLGGVSYETWARGPAHTSDLLAEAYAKQRTVEMRLPGARYGDQRIQMGSGESSFNEPSELIDARSNIKRGTDANPQDPRWLQLEGRFELQEGHEDEAIADLDRARSLRPDDPTILADLGAAYFQRGAKHDEVDDYKQAYQRLAEGLKLKSGDPTLLFNVALAAERIQAPSVAEQAWEAYLKVDSTSGFAKEARTRLAAIKKNLTSSGPTPAGHPLTN